jgi:hypothetical protein
MVSQQAMTRKLMPKQAGDGNAMQAEGGCVAATATAPQPQRPFRPSARHERRANADRFEFEPTSSETALVVRRLVRVLGSFYRLEMLVGQTVDKLGMLARGSRRAGVMERRLLWLLWFLLEYPDGVRTVFDLATCGRFSAVGRQAWAQLLERGPEFAEVRRLRRWGSPFDFLETVGEIVARARWRLYKEREKERRRGGGNARRRVGSARQDAG